MKRLLLWLSAVLVVIAGLLGFVSMALKSVVLAREFEKGDPQVVAGVLAEVLISIPLSAAMLVIGVWSLRMLGRGVGKKS